MIRKLFTVLLIAILAFSSVPPSSSFAEGKVDKHGEPKEQLDRIIDESVKELEDFGYEDITTYDLTDTDQNFITPFSHEPGGAGKWSTISTGSKVLKKKDFYAAGLYTFLWTSIAGGMGKVKTSIIAGLLGVASTSVPSALPGEKLYIKKQMKWVDKSKHIADIRTQEYLQRNGKTVIIKDKVVRDNGWSN